MCHLFNVKRLSPVWALCGETIIKPFENSSSKCKCLFGNDKRLISSSSAKPGRSANLHRCYLWSCNLRFVPPKEVYGTLNPSTGSRPRLIHLLSWRPLISWAPVQTQNRKAFISIDYGPFWLIQFNKLW